jgi:hypothetical protein
MAVRGLGNFDEVGIAQGVGNQTFLSALTRGTDEDKAVKISADDTVALVGTGENFTGVVRTIGEGPTKLTGVQMTGWAELDYTGDDPSVGLNYFVGGSTAGKIALAADVALAGGATDVSGLPRGYFTRSVDATNKTCVIWLG